MVPMVLGSWPVAAAAAPAGVTLAASALSGQPVGTTITWAATSKGGLHPVYRFSIGAGHGPIMVVRDYSPSSTLHWTPLQEGAYTVQVAVEDGFSATHATSATATYRITARAAGARAVVTATANPLVALYSAPACPAGSLVVMFRPAAGSSSWQSTAPQACRAGQSVNVYVAGMQARTRYVMRHVVSAGGKKATSATLAFTTSAPASGLSIAPFTVNRASAGTGADRSLPIVFAALIPSGARSFANPVATDMAGHLVWFYDTLHSDLTNIWPVHILAGGTVLLLGLDRYHPLGDDVLREVDLAGNPVRETNIDEVNASLALRGNEPIYMFHHDALRLPNGDTAVLGATQKRVAGHNVMSDMVVVLDSNFRVVWAWDMFNHFTPPSTWPKGAPICSVLCALPDPKSLDWSHGNGIGWSPQDSNLIFSFRAISAVIKVDFRGGSGTGKVIWRLGKGGDFTVKSSDPYPWFSFQHNSTYIMPNTVAIFDDGNTRCQNGKVKGCQSRGQIYSLDEKHHVATLTTNTSLGSFWQALGSAQGLSNGNSFFAGGFSPPSRSVEVRPNGTKVFELDTTVAEYRAYRVSGMSF